MARLRSSLSIVFEATGEGFLSRSFLGVLWWLLVGVIQSPLVGPCLHHDSSRHVITQSRDSSGRSARKRRHSSISRKVHSTRQSEGISLLN
jgi:hypothetical protein